MKHGRFLRLSARALASCAGLLFAAPLFAQLPVTQLTSIFPPGGKPGTAVEVTLGGNDLEDVERLAFSHPGITAAAKMSTPTEFEKTPKPLPNQFTVKIAGDVPPGVYEVTAIGRFGMSNPRSFAVGTLNEVSDAAGNSTADKPLEVAIGSTVNGRVDQNAYDYLKLTLKQGERVVIDCAAERLDSRLDATMVLLNGAGREVARVRDTLGKDPVLDFTSPVEGAYTLKLFDAVYGGGQEYFYRLSVSAAPLVDFVFPPSGPAGSNNAYTIYGRNLPGGQQADGLVLNGVPLQKVQVNIPLPGDEAGKSQLAILGAVDPRRAWQDAMEFRLPTPQGPANPVAVYFAKVANTLVEQEPNNEPAQATKVALPCELSGQFYPQRDVDWIQFDAKKGESWWIEVISHQLGLASDPAFTLFRITKNDKGEEQATEITQVDDSQERQGRQPRDFDTSNDDPSLKFDVPEDGTYRLMIRDQFGDGRKDPSYVYRLAIRPAEPDFRLLAYPDKPAQGQRDQNQTRIEPLTVRKGGATSMTVLINRRDEYAGEITVTVEGLPGGVTCSGAVIGGEVKQAALVISAAEGVGPWSGPIKIVGRGKAGDRELVREARYAAVVWGTQNRQNQPPEFRLTKSMQLGIIDKDVEPAFVQIGEDKVWETSLGGNIEIPITITRRGDFKENIKLSGDGLPDQIKPKEVNLDGNTGTGKFELQLNQQNIKPGAYTFFMRGETKRKFVRNPDAIPAVEAELKATTDLLTQLNEAVKTATATKDAATKTAQDTANAAKTAEQNKAEAANNAKAKTDGAKAAADKLTQAKEAAAKDAANQGLADAAKAAETASTEAAAAQKKAEEELATADKALTNAQAAAKTAEEARVAAEAGLKAAQDKVTQGNQFKQQLDNRVNQVKQNNQPKDTNFALVSTPIKLRVHPHPFNFTATNPPAALKQGEKQEVAAKVERLYGFAEQVELTFTPPQGVQGLSAQQVNLNKDQADGKLEVVAAANATPGQHACTLRCRGRFNNVQIETTATVMVTVEAKQ
jgi:hypothetical protein